MKTFGVALLRIVGGLLLLYAAGLAIMYGYQRQFIYPAPQGVAAVPPPSPGFGVVELKTSDGLKLRAFYRAASSGKPTLIFFHGNGDSLTGSLAATRVLAAQGYGLLLPEYRGYGGNAGSPSETGLYHDGEAALNWLVAHGVAADRTVLIGNSLGSGVATEMARRQRVSGLVMVSAFASLPHAVAAHYPFIPSVLVRDRYDNVANLRNLSTPVLVLHGNADGVVPIDNGRALADALPAASFQIVDGVGHQLAYQPETQERIATWLATIALPRAGG